MLTIHLRLAKASVKRLLPRYAQYQAAQQLCRSPRSIAKEQEHRFLYNYLPEKIWSMLQSQDTINNKLRRFAHFLIEVPRCRNPSGPTCRLAVRITHVASNIEKPPEDAYDDVRTFADVCKSKRGSIHGTQTMSKVVKDPKEFMLWYPECYPASDPPIDCPVDVATMLERASKETIPIRHSNDKVSRKSQSNSSSPETQLVKKRK